MLITQGDKLYALINSHRTKDLPVIQEVPFPPYVYEEGTGQFKQVSVSDGRIEMIDIEPNEGLLKLWLATRHFNSPLDAKAAIDRDFTVDDDVRDAAVAMHFRKPH